MGTRITDQPSVDAGEVNGGGDEEMLKVRLGQPDVARASQVEGTDALGDRAFDAGPLARKDQFLVTQFLTKYQLG